jgi:type III secretory pathway component EscS
MAKKVITRIKYPVLIAGIVLCLVGIVQAATGDINPMTSPKD